MGCDIHLYLEKKMQFRDGNPPRWVYIEEIDVGRDYELFGFLAGVRSDYQHFERKETIPEDISPELRRELEDWGSDGHSHSWLTLEELQTVDWQDEQIMIPLSGIMDNDQWEAFDKSVKMGKPDYSLMYPYWAAGGDPKTSSYHEWEYPRKLELEHFYNKVVKRMQTVGDCKPNEIRIVFWFDN